jgi:hypothetical protein
MNTNRGIFEAFPGHAGERADSPFKPAMESAGTAANSPFAPVPQGASPFAIADDSASKPGESGKLPERRTMDSPFQMADPSEGFGFEATAASPFKPAVSQPADPAPAKKVADSPFAIEGLPSSGGASPFPQWGQPSAAPAPQAPSFAPFGGAPQPSYPSSFVSDSSSIRQLELRAIFGVDRELGVDEILHRARSLAGIRGIARVPAAEAAAIEALKNLAPQLGSAGPLKMFLGNTPVEFIREGPVLLAVQTDGGFAPGVRETLMIVARELGRLC